MIEIATTPTVRDLRRRWKPRKERLPGLRWSLFAAASLAIANIAAIAAVAPGETTALQLVIDAGKPLQTIDGFGVNVNPAQWRGGNLKPALDLLVDDLGCTLFRVDPVGVADWLDPARRNADGTYTPEYLKSVYTSAMFRDCWETYRVLNAKHVEPFFSISGRIPARLGRTDNPRRLADFDGYAEMVVTLLKWARQEEHLQFSLLSPFNETDIGYPEGPKLEAEDVAPAVKAVLKKLDKAGLTDVRLILLDDGFPHQERLDLVLNQPQWRDRTAAFGFHRYNSGRENQQNSGFRAAWRGQKSDFGQLAMRIHDSPFAGSRVWMTEYGDLDQTGLVESEVGWRSTERILLAINEGFSTGLVWDAFDNFHKHDNAWSTYGLLASDTRNSTYTPKPRYFAAKQLFRFVRPGFVRVAAEPVRKEAKDDPYARWRDPFMHVLLCAFVSPDRKDFTIVGLSRIEPSITLTVSLQGLRPEALQKEVACYRTNPDELCKQGARIRIQDRELTVPLNGPTVFTITTVK